MSRAALDSLTLTRRLRRRMTNDPLLRELRELALAGDVRLCVVGGYVRDAALGFEAGEIDLVAASNCTRLVRDLRRRWRTRGYRFRKRGVTTWRFRLDETMVDIVDASSRGLELDLLRRDLTINAIAFDLGSATVFDPLRGCSDLRAGRLRPPAEGAFRDDPVRALRLCRFIAQFPGFRPTPGARRGAAEVARPLRRAAVERLRQELDKLLMASRPRLGLASMEELGLRRSVLPELDRVVECTAGRGRPDVWTHTLDAVGIASEAGTRRLPGARLAGSAEDRLVLRWALLLHDISKPETLEVAPDGRPTFHGHEVLGQRRADALLRRFRQPAVVRRRVTRLIRLHLRPGHLADARAPARGLRRLVRDAEDDLPLLALHAAADARGSGSPDARVRWARLRSVLLSLLELWATRAAAPPPSLVDGRDVMRVLGLGPGPEVGRILDGVREAEDDGTVRTRREALAYLRKGDVRNPDR